jgi:chromosome segregation ATPase
MSGRLSLRQRAREGASVEERVRVLEQNSAALEGRVDQLESQHDRAERDRQAALEVERYERERQIGDLARKLEATEVGGLYTSLWGLLCVTAGLLLATFSHEISDYLSMIAA